MSPPFFLRVLAPSWNRGIGLVLSLAGTIGFIIGVSAFSDWQVAVETAQVVAGVVEYPRDNPFYMYHAKLWTVLHQVLAVMLKAGVSEKAASLLVSGVLGMVTFQAFATVILALSGDWLIAVGGALMIFFTRPNEFGVNYPIWFMGSTHTYGVLGLSYMLLVIALLGGGWRKAGALLLGMAPAVHPSLAIWLGVIIGLCCVWDIRRFREDWQPWLKFFFIGGAISAVSLLIQLPLMQSLPKTDVADSAGYFNMFVSFWDMHRAPVYSAHPGVIFNWWLLILGLLWVLCLRSNLPSPSILILRAVVVTAVLGLGAMALSWVAPDKVPRPLLMLMPSRLLNLPIVASLPVLVGVLGHYRNKPWSQVLLLLLMAGLLLGGGIDGGMLVFFSSRLWQLLAFHGVDIGRFNNVMVPSWSWIAVIALAATLGAAWTELKIRRASRGPEKKRKKLPPAQQPAAISPAVVPLRWATMAFFAGFLVLNILFTARLASVRANPFNDRTNNPVFAEAAKGNGILLTGGDLHLVQLRTRRPVLLDGGGLDGIAYIVQAAPKMDQILKEVYGVDIFNPPQEAFGQGSVPPRFNQLAWQSIPADHWKALATKYGFTEVLTYADWSLDLPKVIADNDHALFRIP